VGQINPTRRQTFRADQAIVAIQRGDRLAIVIIQLQIRCFRLLARFSRFVEDGITA
jgi:hypothetical protein